MHYLVYLTLLGFFLTGGFALQQYSLLYTDVANSAFFTIFYVPMVPIIVYFLFSEKLHWSIWPSVFACVVGGYFLSDFNGFFLIFETSIKCVSLRTLSMIIRFLGFTKCASGIPISFLSAL